MAKKNVKIPTFVISSILYMVIGILLCVLEADTMVHIIMTITAVFLVVKGIMDLINREFTEGVVYIVIGIAVVLFGWLLTTVAFVVLGVVLIIAGITGIVESGRKNIGSIILNCVTAVCGVLLICNKGFAIKWLSIVTGVILIVNGLLILFKNLRKNKQEK